MHNTWKITVAAMFLLLLIAGCVPNVPAGGMSNPLLPVIDTNGSVSLPASGTPGFKSGENAQWPAYIPQEIPALDGKISTVMEAADSHIRIFYDELDQNQRENYLKLLEEQGFQLEYIIYVQEGFPDNSEKRRKEGDFDAVDITKDQYHMRLAYGDNSATYDVYTSGFKETVVVALAVHWPEDLVGSVPQPERCMLERIDVLPPQVYRITCKIEDDNVAGDYQQILQNAGFIPGEIIQTGDGQIILAAYNRDNLTVNLDLSTSSRMTVEIAVNAVMKQIGWPENLFGVLPAPQRCEINNVLPTSGSDVIISCAAQDEQVTADYITSLLSEGFTESSRMESQSGELISVNLDKGGVHVQLLLGITTELTINVNCVP